jgi:acetyl-CoA carboxylase biotin carboxyl carrier protein
MQPKMKKSAASQPRAKSAATPVPEEGKALDVHAVEVLIEAVERSKISRFVWQRGDEKLCIVRESQEAMAAASLPPPSTLLVATDAPKAAASAVPAEAEEPQGHVIVSPFVGTFYRAPGPEQPPFVELGSNVRKGQALCIVEAMKLMNEIEADISGKVVAILVDNAQPIEFGQALFRLEPSP